MKFRLPLLLAVTAVFWSSALLVSCWAYGNYQSWYYNTYVIEDYSIAELDALTLWIQVPTALLLWSAGGCILWLAFRRSSSVVRP